jgi:hypothetical protein
MSSNFTTIICYKTIFVISSILGKTTCSCCSVCQNDDEEIWPLYVHKNASTKFFPTSDITLICHSTGWTWSWIDHICVYVCWYMDCKRFSHSRFVCAHSGSAFSVAPQYCTRINSQYYAKRMGINKEIGKRRTLWMIDCLTDKQTV